MEDQRKEGKAWEHSWREWRQVETKVLGGRDCDVGGGAQPLKQCTTRLSIETLYHSFGVQTSVIELLVLIGKKLTFKFSTHILYIGPSSPMSNCNSRDECSQAFSDFASLLLYYCEHKWKVKAGKAWERGYRFATSEFVFTCCPPNIQYVYHAVAQKQTYRIQQPLPS